MLGGGKVFSLKKKKRKKERKKGEEEEDKIKKRGKPTDGRRLLMI